MGISCRPLFLQRILTAYSGFSQIEGVAFILVTMGENGIVPANMP